MSSSKKGKDDAVKEDPLKASPAVIEDQAEFPEPSLYFRVFESEQDEPEAKIRNDVNKLYDRWIEKYGRRWPEDGLQTEDMVWLAEEAKKPRHGFRRSSRPSKPAEESEYPNEFMPDDGVEGAAQGQASSSGKAAGSSSAGGKAGQRRPPRSNLEKMAAGGKWVTDEFESADYEAGNLEHLWDMYLWDREGKPTMMPDGPPAQQEGEESEEWDDFYTAYRPRDVDTEEAREAVWATDEFESDEDNTESEWQPEYVGAGLGLVAEDPLNPQYSLRHSNHPLAPFPGEPLKWASYVYPDFTTFEGLTRQSIPHGMGVMTFGTGTGAGFDMTLTRYGDKYEGEFQAGYAHGLGQFTSESTGEVYIGEFFAGQRHGCGMSLDMKPFYYLLERGVEPVEAYRQTMDRVMRNVEVRTWYRGNKLGDAKEDEVVLVNVLKDELDNPFDIALRNKLHDAKLKNWKAMSPREKALDRLVSLIERVQSRNPGRMGSYYQLDDKGRIRPTMRDDGFDTAYDSMDIMQGVNTDGELGPGWDGATDSDENPTDARILELMAAEGMDDKIEDEGFKESVLGKALVNPMTGLDLKTYLDGKERHHRDLVALYPASKRGRDVINRALKAKGLPEMSESEQAPSEVNEQLAAAMSWPRVEDDDDRMSRLFDRAGVSRGDLQRVEELKQRWDALLKEDESLLMGGLRPRRQDKPGNPLAPDDTDTGFETESDMMEMCDIPEILGTVQEAQQIVNRARMWRFKPYGEVTLRMAQDANGSPVNLMQDPLHYPYGTKFMAPGPLGLCHPVPDDPSLRSELERVAHNYAAVYRMYNFDWDPEPGSVQYTIDQRIRRAQELRGNALARFMDAADQVVAEEAAAASAPPAGEGNQALMLASADGAYLPGPSGSGAAGEAAARRGAGPLSLPGGSVFASVSLAGVHGSWGAARLGHATRVVLHAFQEAAKQVPTSRPRLARPGRR